MYIGPYPITIRQEDVSLIILLYDVILKREEKNYYYDYFTCNFFFQKRKNIFYPLRMEVANNFYMLYESNIEYTIFQKI